MPQGRILRGAGQPAPGHIAGRRIPRAPGATPQCYKHLGG